MKAPADRKAKRGQRGAKWVATTISSSEAVGGGTLAAKKDVRLNLIEAGNRVLPALPSHLSDEAIKLLTDLGVHVHTSATGLSAL